MEEPPTSIVSMLFTGSRYIVAGVTLLIAYIALTSQIFVFVPWFMSISLRRTLQVLVPFNIGVGFIYWHYYLACTTEPGSPPPGWGATGVNPTSQSTDITNQVPETETRQALASTGETESGAMTDTKGHSTATDLQEPGTSASADLKDRSKPHATLAEASAVHSIVQNGEKKMKKKPLPRYCRTCEAFKPPRSHHCRICKKCVLKMDHHCPWINNCVGYFNYGHFIRFITWVTITTGFCLTLLIWRIVDAIKNETYYMYRHDGPTKVQIIFMAVNIMVDGGVLLAVGILCIYHLWSMASNTSTIEVWEQEKVEAMIKKGKLRMTKFPYDVGCFRNYRQVLGPRIWFWLWPQQMAGSGTEFDVMDDKDAALIWPPREYQTSKRQDRTVVSEYTSSSINYRQLQQQRSPPRSRNPSGTGNGSPTATTGGLNSSRRGSGSKGRVARRRQPQPEFPTHVRRGSEGWIVQDLSVEQRAELYDRQMQYQRENEHARDDEDEAQEEEEEDYQEGLSDIEGDAYGRLPGGMQGNDYNSYSHDPDHGRRVEQERGQESSEEDDDIPYDVASDEYDDDGYDEYNDYSGGDDDFDEQNPYLGYDDDEDEGDDEEEEEVGGADEDIEDEVTLLGRDRHKIGRFFDSVDPDSTALARHSSSADEEGGRDLEDEWDEGEGVEVGCRPPGLAQRAGSSHSLRYDSTKKTFYTMLVEREEALKKQKARGGSKADNK
ncbi:Palmitoyltransferase [Mortierella alpina]|nr:Palmitoyltransferase [Mortierella alpina]